MDFATIRSAVSAIWNRRGSFAFAVGDRGKSIPQGASTTIYAALSPDIKGGEYLADCKVETYAVHEQASDETAWKRLWEI
eukprot:gene37351-46087_t